MKTSYTFPRGIASLGSINTKITVPKYIKAKVLKTYNNFKILNVDWKKKTPYIEEKKK